MQNPTVSFFPSRLIYENTLKFCFTFLIFYDFHLITVLICRLDFIIYRMSLNTVAGLISGRVNCWWPCTKQEMRPGLFQEYYALCDGELECSQLLTCDGELRCSQLLTNTVTLQWWSFLQKYLTAVSPYLFLSVLDVWPGC